MIRVAMAGCGGVARKYPRGDRAIADVSVTIAIDAGAKEVAAAASMACYSDETFRRQEAE